MTLKQEVETYLSENGLFGEDIVNVMDTFMASNVTKPMRGLWGRGSDGYPKTVRAALIKKAAADWLAAAVAPEVRLPG